MTIELGTPETRQMERTGVATVLIVDDEESTLRICSDIAIESGLRVRTASTTEQALEELDQYPVDIAITDLKVPQLGGLELLRRMREHYPQISVLVLTQYGTIQTAVEATRLGAADYITKPFHIDDLTRRIQRLI
ncbi:MAG TPA: response regulator, partial [Candidatus Acidoferrales bacterium]|nr:response regulator [Candidatus Acidoferrales bacterium]